MGGWRLEDMFFVLPSFNHHFVAANLHYTYLGHFIERGPQIVH